MFLFSLDCWCLNLHFWFVYSSFSIYIWFYFSSQDFLGSTVGRTVGPVVATYQDLSPSHVMRRGGANVWTVWLEISVTDVVMATTVLAATAAKVLNRRWQPVSLPCLVIFLDSDWLDPFSFQHAPVITLEETATLRVVSASALPTQRDTPVTGVRLVTGVMTPHPAARYTQIHTNTHKDTQDTHKETHKYTKYKQVYKDACWNKNAKLSTNKPNTHIHTNTQYTHTYLHKNADTHTNILAPFQPCSCSTAGSSTLQCDLTNGQCRCREGFNGKSCDQCAPGYQGYPACLVCGCHVAGTDEKFCNTTLNVCDCQITGECVCKVTQAVCLFVCWCVCVLVI